MCVPFVREGRPICTGRASHLYGRGLPGSSPGGFVRGAGAGRRSGPAGEGERCAQRLRCTPKDGGCSHRSAEGWTVGGWWSRPVSTGGGTRRVRVLLRAGRGVSA
jgi:hypothetical protein